MFGIMITIPILVAVIFTPTSNPWSISMDFSSCRHGNESWTRPALVFASLLGVDPEIQRVLDMGRFMGNMRKKQQAKCSINGKPIQILVMIIQLLSPYSLGKWCYQSRCKASVWLITLPISCPRCEVQQRLRPNLQICQWLCRYLWAVCCFWGMIPSHVVLNYFAAVILPWCWYGYSPCLPRWCNMFIHSCRLHLRVHSCFFSLQGHRGFVAELCLLVYNCSQPPLSEHKWSLIKYWWMESTLQKKTRAPQLAALISV